MKKPAPKRKLPARKAVVKSSSKKKTATKSEQPIGLKTILVPIDFSDNSKKALRYAIPFAQQFSASLILAYIVEPTIYPSDFGFGQIGFPDVEKELHEKALKELTELKDSLVPQELNAEMLVGTGIPFVEITQFAKEHEVDIIIVATHGRTGVEHILFGSTAEKIIRKAPCPVLVVRSEEHDFIDERV
ncbi:MAG: universal stress protein [Bacteroidota bacterium]